MDRAVDPIRSYIALDIETDGGQYNDSPDFERDNIVSIALYCETWHDPFAFYDVREVSAAHVQQELGHLFVHEDTTFIGHNLQFDLGFLNVKYGFPIPPGDRLWDTMLAERMLTAGDDFELTNLKDTLKRHFEIEVDKSLQTSFTMDSEITPEQIDYIRGDVEWLPKLAQKQAQALSEHGMNQAWEVERYALPVFTDMWVSGVMVDLDRLRPLLEKARIKRDTLQAELQTILTPHIEWLRIEKNDTMQDELDKWLSALDEERERVRGVWKIYVESDQEDFSNPEDIWVKNKWHDLTINKKDGYPEGMRRYVKFREKEWREVNPRPPKPKLDTDLINLNSPVQMPAAFEHLGLPLPNFRSGTLKQKLLVANEEQKRILRMLLEYKVANKLLSSFGERMIAMVRSDGRVRGNWNQIGTGTGRPTCTDPNMLQMPKDKSFRSCFIAAPGHLFVVADYSQMELRIMAQLSKDKSMMQAFKDGVDLHSFTAHLMFNIPLDKVDPDGRERKIAKTINFGVLYGMGPNKLRETLLAEGVEMSFPEAKAAITRWRATFKQASAKIEQMGMEAVSLGYTSTPFGRKRFFNTDFRDENGMEDNGQKFAVMREGANHPIQGTNADITKLAMHLIHETVKPHGGGVRINIYDETVTEIPEHLAEWCEGVVQSCMKVAAEMVLTDIPAKVDSQISRSWSSLDAVA